MSDLTALRPKLYRSYRMVAKGLAILATILAVALLVLMLAVVNNDAPGSGSGIMILFFGIPVAVYAAAARYWLLSKQLKRIDEERARQLNSGKRVASVDLIAVVSGVIGIAYLSYDFVMEKQPRGGSVFALSWAEIGFMAVPTVLVAIMFGVPLYRQARGLPKLNQKVFTICGCVAAVVLPIGFMMIWQMQQSVPPDLL